MPNFNESVINDLSLNLKPHISLPLPNVIEVNPKYITEYDTFLKELIPIANIIATRFCTTHSEFAIDEKELTSLALVEAVYKAFKMWTDPIYPFIAVYIKASNYVFKTYLRDQLTLKRKAITTFENRTKITDEGELSILDLFEDTTVDISRNLEDEFFIKTLKKHLTDNELIVATVLMHHKGPNIGDAYAEAFKMSEYTPKLRVDVHRAKEKIKKVVTNM